MRLVNIQFTLTDSQLNALTSIKRGAVKGWGWPDDVDSVGRFELIALGLLSGWDLTLAGELVISSCGLDSVVNQ